MSNPTFLSSAEGDIRREREAQETKWGQQNHPDGTGIDGDDVVANVFRSRCKHLARTGKTSWRYILLEEVFEALAETDDKPLRDELVQVAAVATAWIEAIDRRGNHDLASE